MLANSAMVNNASSSNPNPHKQFWRGLWKLQVPNKVKVFAWRACNRALPTMDNLTRRHIVDVNLCPVCKTVAKRSTAYGAALPQGGTSVEGAWLVQPSRLLPTK